jgi:hypothetical protein
MIRRLVLATLFATTATFGLAASPAAADPLCIGTGGIPPNITICTPG